MIIYKATNKLNGHFYIGKTSKKYLCVPKKRHKFLIKYPNDHFHRALRKYGWENFEWEVVSRDQVLTNKELLQLEQKYIAELKPQYNSTSGGEGTAGYRHTEETKRKIAEVCRRTFTGRKFSQEHKENLRASIKKAWDEKRKLKCVKQLSE